MRIKVSQKNSVSLKRSQKEKTRIWDVHQLKLSMKRTIFKNFCEFFTGKEEGRQELGYSSSIEIIKSGG